MKGAFVHLTWMKAPFIANNPDVRSVAEHYKVKCTGNNEHLGGCGMREDLAWKGSFK